MDYGAWEGLTYAQIDEQDAERRRAWEVDPAMIRCPDGESANDVAARARSFLVDLLVAHSDAHDQADPDAPPVLAVAHSSFNRILVCVALDLPIREFRLRFQQGQVNLTALRFEHGVGPTDARLLLLNDLEHVRPADAVAVGVTLPGCRPGLIDGRILFLTRAGRMFGYGFLAVVLVLYLAALGHPGAADRAAAHA